MLGTLVTLGVGAAAFRLGMDARRLVDEGKDGADIACALARKTVDDVCSAAAYVREKIRAFSEDPADGPEAKEKK